MKRDKATDEIEAMADVFDLATDGFLAFYDTAKKNAMRFAHRCRRHHKKDFHVVAVHIEPLVYLKGDKMGDAELIEQKLWKVINIIRDCRCKSCHTKLSELLLEIAEALVEYAKNDLPPRI